MTVLSQTVKTQEGRSVKRPLDCMGEEEIPGRPGLVARRMFNVLSEFIAPEHLSFGGGSVLAARWAHRVSLDVDLFCDPGAYESLGRPGLERLEAAIRAIPGCVEESTWCDSIGTYAEIDGIEVTVLPRGFDLDPRRTTRLAGTALALHSNVDILYGKIVRRMYEAGEIAARDLFDIVCARQFDLPALQAALGKSDPRNIETVRGLIRQHVSGERLLNDRVRPLVEPYFQWTGEAFKEAVIEALSVPPSTAEAPEDDGGFKDPGQ